MLTEGAVRASDKRARFIGTPMRRHAAPCCATCSRAMTAAGCRTWLRPIHIDLPGALRTRDWLLEAAVARSRTEPARSGQGFRAVVVAPQDRGVCLPPAVWPETPRARPAPSPTRSPAGCSRRNPMPAGQSRRTHDRVAGPWSSARTPASPEGRSASQFVRAPPVRPEASLPQ